MKKFYEAPVVELNAFSVEDVITTSTEVPVITDGTGFDAAVAAQYAGVTTNVMDYSNYTW